MNNVSSFAPEVSRDQLFKGLNEDAEYQQEVLAVQFSEEVCRLLSEKGISMQEAADGCDMDTARLESILNIWEHPDFEEMSAVIAFLGAEPELTLRSKNDEPR